MKRSKKPRSVFVVCEAGSDLRLLVKILQDLGLRALNRGDALVSGASIASTTRALIANADLICAVLQESSSPQVYLELGFALGLQRPVAIISEASTLPMDLPDLLWIKAPLSDRAALTFQLQAFIASLDVHRSKRSVKPSASGKHSIPTKKLMTPEPPRSSVERSIPTKKLMTPEPPRSSVERELLKALEESSEIESIASQPRADEERGYVPDFAVWLTAAPKFLESPVVIEVKGGGRCSQMEIARAVEQLETYVRAGDARTGLLIVHRPPKGVSRVSKLSPLIFILSLDEARQLLGEGKLVKTLRRERNRVAHSAV